MCLYVRAVHQVAQQVDCPFKSTCLYVLEIGTQALVLQGMLEAFVVAAEMWDHGTLQGGFQGFLQAWEAGVLCVCVCSRACV